jgi:hypothetical protein
MNLQPAAEAEQERRTRSRLEPHREAIFALRRKHWTYDLIAKWLNEHGIVITLSSVQRFCERAVARRPRSPLQPVESEPHSVSHPLTQNKKHRFNLDI